MGCRNDKSCLLVTYVLLMAQRNYYEEVVVDLSGDKSDTVSSVDTVVCMDMEPYCPPPADTVTYLDTVVYRDIVPFRHTVPFMDTVV